MQMSDEEFESQIEYIESEFPNYGEVEDEETDAN